MQGAVCVRETDDELKQNGRILKLHKHISYKTKDKLKSHINHCKKTQNHKHETMNNHKEKEMPNMQTTTKTQKKHRDNEDTENKTAAKVIMRFLRETKETILQKLTKACTTKIQKATTETQTYHKEPNKTTAKRQNEQITVT